jgi:hypothetical protein
VTTPNFDAAIQQAEEKLAEAKRYMAEHKGLYERWANEVAIASRVLDGLRMAAGLPYGPSHRNEPRQQMVPKLDLDVPDPREDAPLRTRLANTTQEVEQPKAASKFPTAVIPNGFDRLAAKRACRTWHIRYPLAPSNQAVATFEKQALIRTIVDSDGYDEWIAQGGKDLLANSVATTVEDREKAAVFCGVDLKALKREARKIHGDIMIYGRPGEDYL